MNDISHIGFICIIIALVIYIVFFMKKTNKIIPVEKKIIVGKDWLNHIFEEIQIITIPSRIQNVKNFCKSMEINTRIFPAILKKDISYNNVYNLKRGEIACALSQEKVLQNFVDSGKQSLIMFEDDIMNIDSKKYKQSNITLDNIKNYVNKVNEYVPMDWDVIYLGRCWDMCGKHIPINKYIVKVHRTLCHHAIAFSREGAIKILANIKHPISMPIDHVVSNLCQKGDITCYASIVPVFYQNREELKTSIGNFDKLPTCA